MLHDRLLLLRAVVLAASGCTALVDGVASDGQQESRIADESDLACHLPESPSLGSCPPACTGGCPAGTCVVACATEEACRGATIACPDSLHCSVRCTGRRSCEESEILCPDGTACDVVCAGDEACKSAVVVGGPSGPVTLACDGQPHECHDTTLLCGASACHATCVTNEQPTVECNDTCDCQPCPEANVLEDD